MTDPTIGRFGAALLDGWIGETPDGTDMAYLLLSTPGTTDTDTAAAMTTLAHSLGTAPGSVAPTPTAEVRATVDPTGDTHGDRWVRISLPGGEYMSRPVPSEWADLALSQQTIVFCLGIRPRGPGEATEAYTDRTSHDTAIALLPTTASDTDDAPGQATTFDPVGYLEDDLGPMLLPGKTYPKPLPGPLAAAYCYLADGGHSIAVAVTALYEPGTEPARWLLPAPVNAVLAHGWTVDEAGLIHCDLPYDSDLGLITDPAHTEF